MLVKKVSILFPHFNFQSLCLDSPGGFSPFVGFWWGFGGVLMGFWLAFSGVNCELLGVWLFISPFLGFWWDFDGVLVGLNGNQLVLVYSHVWWH